MLRRVGEVGHTRKRAGTLPQAPTGHVMGMCTTHCHPPRAPHQKIRTRRDPSESGSMGFRRHALLSHQASTTLRLAPTNVS